MVINDVGEVISREAVGLQQYAFVQFVIVDFNIAVNDVVEHCLAFAVDVLADDIGFAGSNTGFGLFQRNALAGVFELGAEDGFFFVVIVFGLGAEAIMRAAEFHQLVCVFLIQRQAFRLDIRTVFAADVRAFVPVHADGLERVVYDFGCAFDIAFLVGVFNAQNKTAAGRFGDKVFI